MLLQDLKGHLYPFCRDQHGSRLVQQQLEAVDQALLSGEHGAGVKKAACGGGCVGG